MAQENLDSEILERIRLVKSVRVRISEIVFDENNPNYMTESQMSALEKFMKDTDVGFAVDVWLNRNDDGTYLCIDGEHRLRVMIKNKEEYVNAKIFSVPYAKARILRQIANKLKGIHEKKKDVIEFKAIHDEGNLELFSEYMAEPIENLEMILEQNYEGLFEKEETGETPEPPKQPRARPGDIYQLGVHRVMCGDCRSRDDVQALLAGNTVDSLQTDPPYGIDYKDKNSFLNAIDRGNRIDTGIMNDSDAIDDYEEFFRQFLEVIPFSDYNTVYVWMSDVRSKDLRIAFDDSEITFSSCCIWVKNNHVLSRLDHQPKHETCLYGWKGRHRFYGNNSVMSVYRYDKPLSNDVHPMMKPVGMIASMIRESTRKGMAVYDAFLGSGTTLIACEQTERICYGMEMDPAYVDVIIQRWENYTGKKAQKAK